MSDDLIRRFQHGPPVHRPKSLEENLRDDDIEWEERKRRDPGIVARAYDDIVDAMTEQHQAATTDIPDAHAREREEREERARLEAFSRGLRDVLPGIGMSLVRCTLDGHGNGWRAAVKDREGRPFAVSITYDAMIAAGQKHGREMGVHLLAETIGELKAMRERYFARMQ